MKNSKVIVDVNAKNNVGVIAALTQSTGQVNISRIVVEENAPQICKLFHTAAVAMNSIGEDLNGSRVSIIVPEAIAIRCFETLKHKAEGIEGIATALYKEYMAQSAQADMYAAAIDEFATAFCAASEKKVNINFVNARTLYRHELVGLPVKQADGTTKPADLTPLIGMDKIDLVNSVNEDLGVQIRPGEFSFANGTYTLVRRNSRPRNGQGETVSKFYVNHKISLIIGGERKTMDVSEAMQLTDMTGVRGYNDTQSTLLNVIRFRALAAAELPRMGVIGNFTVSKAD